MEPLRTPASKELQRKFSIINSIKNRTQKEDGDQQSTKEKDNERSKTSRNQTKLLKVCTGQSTMQRKFHLHINIDMMLMTNNPVELKDDSHSQRN